jgi:outer membrane cobalamin receptor
VPNPELKEAERAWNAEVGVHLELNLSPNFRRAAFDYEETPFKWFLQKLDPSLIIDDAVFWSRYKNMIDVDINPDVMAFQFVTAGSAQILGNEVSTQVTFFNGALGAHLGYTWLDPIDLVTNKTLKYRSRHRVLLGAQLRIWRFMLGWDYRYASEIEEVVNVFYGDERVPMHVMDGRLIFDTGPVQIGFEARNFRNYHYTLRQRFLEPVRSYTLTLRGML